MTPPSVHAPTSPAGAPAPSQLRAGRSRPAHGLVQGSDLLADRTLGPPALGVALRWLERDTALEPTAARVGHDDLREWIDEPLEEIERALGSSRARAGAEQLRRDLHGELDGARVLIGDLHPVALGRWWFSPTLDEVVQVDGWTDVAVGVSEADAVLLVASVRAIEEGTTLASTYGDLLTRGWSPGEAEALAPHWNRNRHLRPSTVVLLAFLHAWTRQDLDGAGPPLDDRAIDEVTDLFEQLAPGGAIDLVAADRRLRVRPADDTTPAVLASRAVTAAVVRTADQRLDRRARAKMAAIVGSAVSLWLAGTWGIDPAAMTDLGLVSILRPIAYLAPVLLVIGFFIELGSARPSPGRLGAPVVALVVLLHGTPSVLYGTLRYSWAWKHLGIVDYISRNGSVDPGIGSLDIYHSWPGFFSVNSAVVGLLGLAGAEGYARWWPMLINLAAIPVLLLVYRSIGGTAGRRTAWLAVLLFTAANWIGQDYFSPQSVAYLLYLLIIGIVLQFTAKERAVPGSEHAQRPGRWSIAVAVLAAAALVTSHQLTPVVLIMALLGLTITRRRVGTLIAGVAGMAVLWSLTGAWTYIGRNIASLVEGFGDPAANTRQNLVDQATLSPDQVIVSTAGRSVVLAIVVLAIIGFVRQLRGGRVDLTALVLVLAPMGLLVANSFGGEIVFRTYLFALPFLAWYAATALWPVPPADAPELPGPAVVRRRQIVGTVLTVVLLAGFSLAYYGKDAFYRFSGEEVAASAFVLQDAPANSLLVTVNTNYPGLWVNYERVTAVPIADEPAESLAEVLDAPAATLGSWLGEGTYRDGYVLLSRAQEREAAALGQLPEGAYDQIRSSLDDSPLFTVVWSAPDATVYQLAPRPR